MVGSTQHSGASQAGGGPHIVTLLKWASARSSAQLGSSRANATLKEWECYHAMEHGPARVDADSLPSSIGTVA